MLYIVYVSSDVEMYLKCVSGIKSGLTFKYSILNCTSVLYLKKLLSTCSWILYAGLQSAMLDPKTTAICQRVWELSSGP